MASLNTVAYSYYTTTNLFIKHLKTTDATSAEHEKTKNI